MGRMRQTIILAAGNGRRISGDHADTPKPLIPVAGRPLIEHALGQAVSAGCEEAVVVVGKHADAVRGHLERIDVPLRLVFAYNPNPDSPNGRSLLTAEPHADPQFFLQMADHVFAQPVLRELESPDSPGDHPRLLVDAAPADWSLEDATKVRIQDGQITHIGKSVSPWDAVDAGYFVLDHRVFDALHTAAKHAEPSVSAGMRVVIASQGLRPVPLPDVPWIDVDNARDRDRAEEMLGSITATP